MTNRAPSPSNLRRPTTADFGQAVSGEYAHLLHLVSAIHFAPTPLERENVWMQLRTAASDLQRREARIVDDVSADAGRLQALARQHLALRELLSTSLRELQDFPVHSEGFRAGLLRFEEQLTRQLSSSPDAR